MSVGDCLTIGDPESARTKKEEMECPSAPIRFARKTLSGCVLTAGHSMSRHRCRDSSLLSSTASMSDWGAPMSVVPSWPDCRVDWARGSLVKRVAGERIGLPCACSVAKVGAHICSKDREV